MISLILFLICSAQFIVVMASSLAPSHALGRQAHYPSLPSSVSTFPNPSLSRPATASTAPPWVQALLQPRNQRSRAREVQGKKRRGPHLHLLKTLERFQKFYLQYQCWEAPQHCRHNLQKAVRWQDVGTRLYKGGMIKWMYSFVIDFYRFVIEICSYIFLS